MLGAKHSPWTEFRFRHQDNDYLKIDGSFVAGIPDNTDDVAISKAIIAVAKSLGIQLIAEGVENAAQRKFLRVRGCREAQGFLFGKPMPAAAVEPLLGERRLRRVNTRNSGEAAGDDALSVIRSRGR